MSSIEIGFAAIGGLLILIGLRFPVGFALSISAIVGIAAIRGFDAAMGVLETMPFAFVSHWSLTAVPMFLLMGSISYHSGLTASLYTAMRQWLSGLPGGLAVASNLASAGFAAASGSSMATAAAMGRLAIPEMLRFGYNPGLATGVIAASGTLGSLIPPSILMVLYGVFAEQPIGKMLIAGIVPGLLTAAAYTTLIVVRCSFDPSLAPPVEEKVSFRQKVTTLLDVWPLPVVVVAVIGGIYSGIVSATEAAAFGAMVTALIALSRGKLTLYILKESILETLKSTATIFFIAIGAMLLTRFLAISGLGFYFSSMVDSWGVNPLALILMASVIYLILGMFLDPIGLMLLTLPVMLPIFENADLNLIWVGVIVVKYLEIGLLTPPVGLNVYVVKGIVGNQVSLPEIFKGVSWFLLAEVFVMALLIAFPQISLILPNLME